MSSALTEWLEKNDIDMYARKEKMPAARKRFKEETGEKCSRDKFREAVSEHCEWYRSFRRRNLRRSVYLSEKSWTRLKGSVSRHLAHLHGRPIGECVEIIRSEEPCSKDVLRGLPKRLHVWAD